MVVHACNLRAKNAETGKKPGTLWPLHLAELVSSSFSETALNNKVKTGGENS